MVRQAFAWMLVAVASSGVACQVAAHGSRGANAGGGPTTITSGSGGAAPSGAGGSGAGGPTCKAPEPAPLGEQLTLGTVKASLIDQQGKPAEAVVCSLCGTNLCSKPMTSDATGAVTLQGPGAVQLDARFNVGYDGRGYAKMSAIIPSPPDHDFTKVMVVRLPAQGVPLVAGKDAASGGVTVRPAQGAVVKFDDILFSDPADQLFRAAIVDIRKVDPIELPAIDPKLGLEVLIATAALGTKICPAGTLRFENVAGWPDGTEVDIYVNGTETFDNYAPYGQWAIVAAALVDPGGATVTTKPGGGIEQLGTFGARPKP